MADNVTTLVYRGAIQYAKVLGDPVLNYNKDGQEWKFDFIPDDDKAAAKELKSLGVGDRLRSLEDSEGNPRYGGSKYMSFKQNANRKDGTPNIPIRVVDAAGNPWNEDELIGNGSRVDVKFVVIDNGKGRFNGVYPRSIRVLELVPYRKEEFEPLDENDEFFEAARLVEQQTAEQRAKDMTALTGGKIEFKDDDLDDVFPEDEEA